MEHPSQPNVGTLVSRRPRTEIQAQNGILDTQKRPGLLRSERCNRTGTLDRELPRGFPPDSDYSFNCNPRSQICTGGMNATPRLGLRTPLLDTDHGGH